jgi:hypothetical protein
VGSFHQAMGVTVAAAVVIAHLPCSSQLAFGASATFQPAFAKLVARDSITPMRSITLS